MAFFIVALAGLTVLVGAAVFSRRTGIAAPLLLLLLGIAAGLTPALPNADVEPEIILAGVLPPLLHASSVQMPVLDLRRNRGMIAWLSVVMVVVSALVIGAVVHLLFPAIPFPLAVALGAVVSPTDAVAATTIGRRLGLPPRLMTVLEGESLFNDAAALVTLRTAVAALASSFSVTQAVAAFAWATVGGVVVGVVTGVLAVAVRSRLGDPVLSTTVSFAVPWIAFFPAEEIGASGIIAVVLSGLVAGHRGRTRLSALERSTETTTWSTVSFVLEHAVFLVMGLEVSHLLADARAEGGIDRFGLLCTVVFACMVLLRVVGVAVPLGWQRLRPDRSARLRERLSAASERVREMEEQQRIAEDDAERWHVRIERSAADLDFAAREPITRRGGVVLAWAGMRGVVTLAAAQTITPTVGGAPVPYRSTIVLVAFTVAVVSLVVFGGTLPWVIRRLRFRTPTATDRRVETTALLRDLGRSVVTTLGPLEDQRVDGAPLLPEAVEITRRRFAPIVVRTHARLDDTVPDARAQSLVVQRRYLEEYRTALAREQFVGAYSAHALTEVQDLLDREERRLDRLG